jgi:manganese/zinc/iron transport system substrate-binding protein
MSRAAVMLGTVAVLAAILTAAYRFGTAGAGVARVGAGDSAARVRVVATTSIVADAVRAVGGERLAIATLMGPGVDPHLFKASEGDVTRMAEARAIFYGGLHLEGKMAEVFAQLAQHGATAVAVSDGIPRRRLRRAGDFSGSYDPHVWFDVSLWREVVGKIRDVLTAVDPGHAEHYRQRAERYLSELRALDDEVRRHIALVPPARRMLITAHDAFGYFGRAYGLEVHGVQSLSTSAEAGAADVQRLADLIARKRIPALFLESSVPPRIVEAVQAAVRARGFAVRVGGELYSDALGDPRGPAGTYLGMLRHNTSTIVSALLGQGNTHER